MKRTLSITAAISVSSLETDSRQQSHVVFPGFRHARCNVEPRGLACRRWPHRSRDAAPPGSQTGWLVYFAVDDVDAAQERLKAPGGHVRHGPSEVPGGSFTIACADPQRARFGLVGPLKS
ncbi:VOC family protein [Jiella mangrovi]|uniref:VOC family protein n=1 Tax=Jiella mangrovi TaxID=2821407 RepID=UPI003CC90D4C